MKTKTKTLHLLTAYGKALVVLTFSMYCCNLSFAQFSTIGIQLGNFDAAKRQSVDQFSSDQTLTRTPRYLNLTTGIFGERHRQNLYYRASLDFIVDRSSLTYRDQEDDSTWLDLDNRFRRYGGIVGLEVGRDWTLAERLHLLTGVQGSYMMMLPGTGEQHEELYEASQLSQTWDVEVEEGAQHEAWLGLTLRLHYDLSQRLTLGLATRYDLRLALNQRDIVRHITQRDAAGNLVEEQTLTDTYDYKTVTLGERVVPVITLGWRFGE